MSQRVNIQYSIKLADLGTEIHRLVDQVDQELDSTWRDMPFHEVDSLSLEALRRLALYRDALSAADQSLGDVMTIINGYIKFQTSQTYNVNQEQLEDSAGHQDYAQSLTELEERLSQMKTSLQDPNAVPSS